MVIRQYIPKSRPLESVTDQEIKWIEDQLDNRPRKRLVLQHRTKLILSTQTTCCTTDLNSRRFLMEIFARRARTCGKLVARAMAAVAILALIGGFSPTPPPNTCCITPTFRIFVPSICPFQCTNVRVEIVMHDGIRHRYYTVNGTYSVPSGGSGLSDISGAFCFKGRWEMYANVTCNGRVYRYNLVALWKCPTKTSGTESFIVPFTLKCPS